MANSVAAATSTSSSAAASKSSSNVSTSANNNRVEPKAIAARHQPSSAASQQQRNDNGAEKVSVQMKREICINNNNKIISSEKADTKRSEQKGQWRWRHLLPSRQLETMLEAGRLCVVHSQRSAMGGRQWSASGFGYDGKLDGSGIESRRFEKIINAFSPTLCRRRMRTFVMSTNR